MSLIFYSSLLSFFSRQTRAQSAVYRLVHHCGSGWWSIQNIHAKAKIYLPSLGPIHRLTRRDGPKWRAKQRLHVLLWAPQELYLFSCWADPCSIVTFGKVNTHTFSILQAPQHPSLRWQDYFQTNVFLCSCGGFRTKYIWAIFRLFRGEEGSTNLKILRDAQLSNASTLTAVKK